MPEETETTTVPENNTIVVPLETEKTVQPVAPVEEEEEENNNIIIIPENNQQPLEENIFIIEEPEDTKKTEAPKQSGKLPTIQQPPQSNEPDIFFEEDLPAVKTNTKPQNKKEPEKEKEKQKQTKIPANELEDEYYELEGF